MKLLFCSANPHHDLNLVNELEEVLQRLDASAWKLTPLPNVSLKTLENRIKAVEPDIVHFCGHSGENEIVLTNPNNGTATPVSPSTFAKTLELSKPLTAVILNSCQSVAVIGMLRGIAKWGIGTSRDVTDESCITFTKTFYARLSTNPEDVPDAYSYALQSLSESDRKMFHLLNLQVTEERNETPGGYRIPVWARALLVGLALSTFCLGVATLYLSDRIRSINDDLIAIKARLHPVLEDEVVFQSTSDGPSILVGNKTKMHIEISAREKSGRMQIFDKDAMDRPISIEYVRKDDGTTAALVNAELIGNGSGTKKIAELLAK